MFVCPSRLTASTIRVLPRKRLSRALGKVAQVQPSRLVMRSAIELFRSAYHVDLSETEVPEDGFTSFDAFFTRRLKPGARPVDIDPNAIVSPADGRVQDLGFLEPGATLRVKGSTYRLDELLGDPSRARLFEAGAFVVIYLSPRDYHRVHAPVDGRIESLRYIGGTLFPVNELGLRHIEGLFSRNERIVFYQQSPRHGRVATVMVGALGVGRISVSFDSSVVTNNGRAPGIRLYDQQMIHLVRGNELGIFHLGSTVILLLQSGCASTLVKRSGEAVRVGEAMARTSNA